MLPLESRPLALALNNDDILREIVVYFAIGSDPIHASSIGNLASKMKTSRRCLYNAALVSRAFASPALDFLWQAMSSIKPLFDLLPVVLRSGQLNKYSVAYEAYNLEQGVKRFTRYAEKVQMFYYLPQEEPTLNLDWEFFQALKNHPAIPSPLLPNLHTLYVSSLPENINHAVLFHILSTSLRFVRVSSLATVPSHYIRTFMTCLLTQARDLQHFQVDNADEIPKEVQDQLLSFRQLRDMHITSLNPKIFWPICALDELPNLVTLSMDFSSQLMVTLKGVRIPCRSVKVLDIACPVSLLFELLAALEAPNLCEAYLDFLRDTGEHPTRDRAGDPSVVGAVAKWASSLRILSVYMAQRNLLKLLRDPEWPLIQFKRLQLMEVQARGQSYNLFDTERGCWELARSFPNVGKLSLPVSCLIPFKSLLSLVFLLGIDTASPLDVLGATAISFPNKLQTISVGDTSIVANHFLLAHSLIISFPNLAHIISPSPTWGYVNDLIRFVRSLDVAKPPDKIISPKLSQSLRSRMVQDLADCRLPEELRFQ
ncbi:hypothetical protein BDN72DRAFT_306184 [Pluteus cervinus]|uniref:Uncharacterized protein n=1 Tax=Pluteus cervinus TaxID=181527 RepID=A0ACD3ADD1_9AGAR|nr:hypothetical protein BDN72DRAFT_306184 [Pluteus cervinus]